MNGLPRVKDTSRPRDSWQLFVLAGVERMTEALRRGEPIDGQSVADMVELSRRLNAFEAALNMRLEAAKAVLEE